MTDHVFDDVVSAIFNSAEEDRTTSDNIVRKVREERDESLKHFRESVRFFIRPTFNAVRDNPQASGRVVVEGGRDSDDYIRLVVRGHKLEVRADMATGRIEIQESSREDYARGSKSPVHRFRVDEWSENDCKDLVKAFLKRALAIR